MPTYRSTVIATLTFAAFALAAVGIVATRQVSQLRDDTRLVEHTQEVIARVQRVLTLEVDSETGMRGFVITGNDAFLAPYLNSRVQMDEELSRLRNLVGDNPAQMARVTELSDVTGTRTKISDEVVERRRENGFDAARELVATQEGKRVMDRVRVVTDTIIRSEQDLLAGRRRQSAETFRAAQLVTIGGTIGTVFALAVAGRQIAAELRKRRAAEASVRLAYEDVEAKVHARTRELEFALQQLRASDDQFRLVTELSPVYLFRADAQGACEFLSTGFFAFTGLTPERARGFGWTEAIDPEDRGHLMTAWSVAMSDSQPCDTECRLRSKSGQSRWFRVRLVPTADLSGRAQSWIGAAIDIHELKDAVSTRALALGRAQEAQRESEAANQLKDEFLATVSHELRTPLNAIVGWAHVLNLSEVTDAERLQAVRAIQRNAQAQTRLIEDLLDVSSMIQGRLNIVISPVDLRAIAREAIETVSPAAHARSILLDLQVEDDPVVIDGDPNRLQQIVWNLLSNAIKFTTKGGRVRISVDRMGSRGRVHVEDSGEGIEPTFLPHVFEPFRQGPSATMRSGLGLGLAIVRRLVELHGGAIVAESAGRGRGASFVVTFPLQLGPSLTRVPSGAERPRALAGVMVLLVEDDEDSAAALAAVLRLRGCQVRAARTASECLRVLAEWHPDVLLCDIGLPDDDGYSLLRRARSTPGYGNAPAIALTAYAGGNDRARALAAGFTAHISKPFDPDTIVREITSAVKSRDSHL